ncbi:hypothetical protein B0T09DRAFT_260856 [Sordaria sp. MPI-SDFR-AT-0083]|nr:hypothetical protein B0T09DRAFT_260856 [Sordaria sp. MPI-SDFR-AT-0083]
MYGILHAGGVYCGRCLVRPSPAPGRSCPRCYAMRTADTLRRRMEALIRRAEINLQATIDVVPVENQEQDAEAAAQAVDNAHLACIQSSPILEAAFEILARMHGIHVEKAVEAEGVLIAALTRTEEVTNLVADALLAVVPRQAGLG